VRELSAAARQACSRRAAADTRAGCSPARALDMLASRAAQGSCPAACRWTMTGCGCPCRPTSCFLARAGGALKTAGCIIALSSSSSSLLLLLSSSSSFIIIHHHHRRHHYVRFDLIFCRFEHLGATAISALNGSSFVSLVNNTFDDISCSAVSAALSTHPAYLLHQHRHRVLTCAAAGSVGPVGRRERVCC
jgi:hypothetical protein